VQKKNKTTLKNKTKKMITKTKGKNKRAVILSSDNDPREEGERREWGINKNNLKTKQNKN
jgi:hypothetical protein